MKINATCISYKHEGWLLPAALILQDKTSLIKTQPKYFIRASSQRKTVRVPYRAGLAKDQALRKDRRKKKSLKNKS